MLMIDEHGHLITFYSKPTPVWIDSLIEVIFEKKTLAASMENRSFNFKLSQPCKTDFDFCLNVFTEFAEFKKIL